VCSQSFTVAFKADARAAAASASTATAASLSLSAPPPLSQFLVVWREEDGEKEEEEEEEESARPSSHLASGLAEEVKSDLRASLAKRDTSTGFNQFALAAVHGGRPGNRAAATLWLTVKPAVKPAVTAPPLSLCPPPKTWSWPSSPSWSS